MTGVEERTFVGELIWSSMEGFSYGREVPGNPGWTQTGIYKLV